MVLATAPGTAMTYEQFNKGCVRPGIYAADWPQTEGRHASAPLPPEGDAPRTALLVQGQADHRINAHLRMQMR